jgi:hypothetical protein
MTNLSEESDLSEELLPSRRRRRVNLTGTSPVSPPSLFALCAFIGLLSFKPSEPHLTTYLVDNVGLSDDDVNNYVYPVWTYSYLPLLILLGGAAESLDYTPVIIVGAVGRLITRLLLLFGTTVAEMQLMQITYALGSVGEIVFYAYVFHCVKRSEYQMATSAAQACHLFAHVLGGLCGDFCLNALGAPVALLFWLSLASVVSGLAVSLACFRPTRRFRSMEVAADSMLAQGSARMDVERNSGGTVEGVGVDDTEPDAEVALAAAAPLGVLRALRETFSVHRRPRFLALAIFWACARAVYQVRRIARDFDRFPPSSMDIFFRCVLFLCW